MAGNWHEEGEAGNSLSSYTACLESNGRLSKSGGRRGLSTSRWSNFYDRTPLLTGRGPWVWEQHCGAGQCHPWSCLLPPPLPSSTGHRRRLEREDVEWAKYRSNNVCVGVLEGMVAPCRRLAVYQGRSMMVPEIIITGPHCLCVQSVPASNVRVETCASARYRTISGRRDTTRLMNPRSISQYRMIYMNPRCCFSS